MLRHSRDITRFNRERYIRKRKNIWWVRKFLWEKSEGILNKFDLEPIKTGCAWGNSCPVCITDHSYNRAKVKRETAGILKDYNIR